MLQGRKELYGVVQRVTDFMRSYRVVLVCTELYGVLQGGKEFYGVVNSRTELYGV